MGAAGPGSAAVIGGVGWEPGTEVWLDERVRSGREGRIGTVLGAGGGFGGDRQRSRCVCGLG